MPKPNDPPQPVDVDGAPQSPAPDAPTAEAGGFVAKGPITIDGARAYNKGDRVSARAVAKHNLEDQVQKA